MKTIVSTKALPVKTLLALILLSSCTVIPPQQEHYMLRADYFRALDEQRIAAEAEKNAIRERLINVQAELSREEGRRLQLEDESADLRKRLLETQARLTEQITAAERDAKAHRAEMEESLSAINRLKTELETTRSALSAREAENAQLRMVRETTVVLVRDIAFKKNAFTLDPAQKTRISELAMKLRGAAHISIAGHADRIEAGNLWTLSGRRASEVALFMTQTLQIPSSRITVVGQGAEASLGDGRSNFRVEIVTIERAE